MFNTTPFWCAQETGKVDAGYSFVYTVDVYYIQTFKKFFEKWKKGNVVLMEKVF